MAEGNSCAGPESTPSDEAFSFCLPDKETRLSESMDGLTKYPSRSPAAACSGKISMPLALMETSDFGFLHLDVRNMRLQVQTDGQQDVMCGRFPFRISFSLVRCMQKDNLAISLLAASLTFGLLSGKAMLTTGFIEQSVPKMIFDIGWTIEVEEEVENMVRGSWFCTSNAKSMLVKIVHPGGHIKLHDSPVLAAEILHRNPKCCIAYSHVFQQPWAIVAPDTVEQFYVVPINTVRILQQLYLRRSPSMLSQSTSPYLGTNPLSTRSNERPKDRDERESHTKYGSLKKKSEDDEFFSKGGCLPRLFTGLNVKDKPEEWSESTRSLSSSGSSDNMELM